MLLTIHVRGKSGGALGAVLGEELERAEEFWFGRGLAWVEPKAEETTLRLSLLVDIPRLVAQTKRRDREEKTSVGFCDPYAYTAAGLMGYFLAQLRPKAAGRGTVRVEVELVSYPDRLHSNDVARRLFSPLGFLVRSGEGSLHLEGDRALCEVLDELPAVLLTLDPKARLFLQPDELAEIRLRSSRWIGGHPARRGIELALQGRRTPLRFLLAPGAEFGSERARAEGDAENETVLQGEAPISTGLIPSVSLASSQRDFAVKAFSRMNMNRNWLIFLPSAVASLQGGNAGGELERPESALNYFRAEKIDKAVVEEKHMGSRGIVVLCRTLQPARDRFDVEGEIPGCAYTRNGRRFFKDEDTEAVFIERLERVFTRSNFWKRFSTDWVLLDGEILPWAVKAAESSEESGLVEAGTAVFSETMSAFESDSSSPLKAHWKETIERERSALEQYDVMFKRYRTESANLAALKFAPFHLLATEGQTFFHRSHLWHMQMLAGLARSGREFVIPTRYEVVSLSEQATWSKTIRWWEELSEESSEGLVVKPLPFIPRGRRGLAQPALKCRSREHLRLVYGPRYDSAEGRESLLARDALLRRRNKHRRILRQFALSMEAVTRFVKRSPLNAVHECVLGVLAQEVPPSMPT